MKNDVRRGAMVPSGYIRTPRDYTYELVRDFVDIIKSIEEKTDTNFSKGLRFVLPSRRQLSLLPSSYVGRS